jgi:hypothetical protein
MRGHQRKARRGQAAVSLVEFAIVAPLFMILVFLVIDFGKAIYVKNTLDSAVREAARAGVVLTSASGGGEPTSSDMEKAAKNHSSDVGLANPSPYCTPSDPPTSDNSGFIYIGPTGSAPGGDPQGSGPCPSGTSYNVSPVSGQKPLTVTIAYCYRPLFPLLSSVLALATSGPCKGGITLKSTSTMQTEY